MPKSLYRTAEELENEEVKLWTESIYKTASVFKGAPHEVRFIYWRLLAIHSSLCLPDLSCMFVDIWCHLLVI